MTETEFSQILKEMIEQLPYTKNEIIERTGINRSTFFKLLSGKRFPTAGHMLSLLRGAGLSASDQEKLERAYESVNHNYLDYNNIEIVRTCVSAVKNAETRLALRRSSAVGQNRVSDIESSLDQEIRGSIACANAIREFIRLSTFGGGEKKLFAFLPRKAAVLLEDIAPVLNAFREIQVFCQLSDLPGNDPHHTSAEFPEVIPFIMQKNCSLFAFYGKKDVVEGAGFLFPYYVISDAGVLLVGAAMDRALFIRDDHVRRGCLEAFQNALPLADEITVRGLTLPEIHRNVISSLRKSRDEQLIILGFTPCMALMATDPFIDVFVPEEEREAIRTYCHVVQGGQAIEIVSADGLRLLAETGGLTEWGLHAQVSSDALTQVLLALKARLGTTLFVADSSHLTIPEDWIFYVIPDSSVTLIPKDPSSTIVSLAEKHVLNAFYSVFDGAFDYFVLANDAAERILDSCIDHVKGMR